MSTCPIECPTCATTAPMIHIDEDVFRCRNCAAVTTSEEIGAIQRKDAAREAAPAAHQEAA